MIGTENNGMNAVSEPNDMTETHIPLSKNPNDRRYDFLQDIATFYFSGDGLSSITCSALNVLDGTTRQKVLSVACLPDNTVIIGLQGYICRLNPLTKTISLLDDPGGTNGPNALHDANLQTRSSALNVSAWLLDVTGIVHVPEPLPVETVPPTEFYTEDAPRFLTELDGIPLRHICCAARAVDGTLWGGGSQGAGRLREGVWRCIAGKRWLPDDRVNAIAIDTAGRAWIATEGGLACIESLPMIWGRKAAHYEAVTLARHNRGGFVTECLLKEAGNLDSFAWEASDNDGLWTSLYLCAECFRWAVTGEEEARDLARQSLRAMLSLLHWTGIPGFPARAVARRDPRVTLSEPAANWLPSPLDTDMLYKTDTSSDEIAGHYLAWFVYHTLVANEAEKAQIADACRAVTDHILDHDYTLVGPTGRRTSWGLWTPDVLNHDPEWAGERGLASLEILSHLRVALHLCPCARYEQAYQTLVTEHDFALNTVRQKILPPDGEDNHSDDELAACAYYPLLSLETDPRLRALYLHSLERTNVMLQPARSPFHNVIYQACTGRLCDVQAVVSWLEDAPLDLRDWPMTNSHRRDVTLRSEPDRFGRQQSARPLPPSEIGVMKWNRNPYTADWPGEGTREMDGAFWLLPYWMGRYHGILPSCDGVISTSAN